MTSRTHRTSPAEFSRGRRTFKVVRKLTLALLSLSILASAAVSVSAGSASAATLVSETMVDRCSKGVFIPATYGGEPGSGGVTLVRPESGFSDWTPPFAVTTSRAGRIRWWCNSVTGNLFDPGTWRVDIDFGNMITCGLKLVASGAASVVTGGVAAGAAVLATAEAFVEDGCVSADFGTSAVRGWTPERSRCDSRTNILRARLGPNRKLEIQCLENTSAPHLANIAAVVSQLTTRPEPAVDAAVDAVVDAARCGHSSDGALPVGLPLLDGSGPVSFTLLAGDGNSGANRIRVTLSVTGQPHHGAGFQAEYFNHSTGSWHPAGRWNPDATCTANANGTMHNFDIPATVGAIGSLGVWTESDDGTVPPLRFRTIALNEQDQAIGVYSQWTPLQ